jgi:hypothetical protein
MRIFTHIFKIWLPLAVAVSALSVLTYAAAQQIVRQDLNDPQIQLAEDASQSLRAGTLPQAPASGPQVEMSTSLAPFLMTFDANGSLIASSGVLHGRAPQFPLGALAAARASGENRVTWQPEPLVRIAAVVVAYPGGFVMAGRNMREGEQRIAQIGQLAALGWISALAATLLAAVAAGTLFSERSAP